jgi:uncharacterized integral membrane protein
MDNLRKVNLVLLVLWVMYSIIFALLILLGVIDFFTKPAEPFGILQLIYLGFSSTPILFFNKAVKLIKTQVKSDYNVEKFTKNMLDEYKLYTVIFLTTYVLMNPYIILQSYRQRWPEIYPEIINLMLLFIFIFIVLLSIYKIYNDSKLINSSEENKINLNEKKSKKSKFKILILITLILLIFIIRDTTFIKLSFLFFIILLLSIYKEYIGSNNKK